MAFSAVAVPGLAAPAGSHARLLEPTPVQVVAAGPYEVPPLAFEIPAVGGQASPLGGASGITGSGAAGQLAVFSATKKLTSYGTLTFDGATLTDTGGNINLTNGYYQCAAAFPAGTCFYAPNGGAFQTGAATLHMLSGVPDGASAVGVRIGTANALATAGAKLVSITNAGTEKAYVDKDGAGFFALARGLAMVGNSSNLSAAEVLPGTLSATYPGPSWIAAAHGVEIVLQAKAKHFVPSGTAVNLEAFVYQIGVGAGAMTISLFDSTTSTTLASISTTCAVAAGQLQQDTTLAGAITPADFIQLRIDTTNCTTNPGVNINANW
ncbi:MAG: hypothetical protein QM723_07030 [Myxococcaceae bacterium]